jgi:hypothetical protein
MIAEDLKLKVSLPNVRWLLAFRSRNLGNDRERRITVLVGAKGLNVKYD